jgi:hypothetical protein
MGHVQLDILDEIKQIPLGELSETDLEGLSASLQRVYNLMKDGLWHSADEIRLIAGDGEIPASEGLRRMRQLRTFHPIEKRRSKENSRLFEYKLVI